MVYDACEYELQIRKIAGARKNAHRKDTYREKKSRLRAEDHLLPHSEKFRNLDPETVRAIAMHIDRKRLMSKVEEEGVSMCQAFDELMEDKRLEGMKEGERKGRLSIISHLLAAGMEESQILKVTQCSEEEILLAAGR